MLAYIARRLLGAVPTLLLLVFAVVLLVRIVPGNVIDAAIADQPQLTPEDRGRIEHALGLDAPPWIQYARYLENLARGSLGTSLWTNRPVWEQVKQRLPVTVELTVMALVMAVAVSVPAGILAAMKQNRPLDYALRLVAVGGLSLPAFIVGTYALLLPAVLFGVFVPPYRSPDHGLVPHLVSLLLPSGILAFELSANIVRMTRTMTLEVLRQDYIRTARAKGLRERTVLVRHVARNALIPVLTVISIQFVALFSGVVIIEEIFGIHGLGQLMLAAFATRDYTMIQGITFFLGAIVIVTNLLVDISYAFLDPRIRL